MLLFPADCAAVSWLTGGAASRVFLLKRRDLDGSRWSGDSWAGSRWTGTTWTGTDWAGSRLDRDRLDRKPMVKLQLELGDASHPGARCPASHRTQLAGRCALPKQQGWDGPRAGWGVSLAARAGHVGSPSRAGTIW